MDRTIEQKTTYFKYQAAGNAYIVIEKSGLNFSPRLAMNMCSSIYGVGGDGVICWEKSDQGVIAQIINPDGSIAEKSGNGLRILATFLFEQLYQNYHRIVLKTISGDVVATVRPDEDIVLEMGKPVFPSEPNLEPNRSNFPDCVELNLPNQSIQGYEVSMGNPHFVILSDELDLDFVKKIGPLIENHDYFPNRTNVQFIQPIGRKRVKAIIWERGAGYTLSSGSSSCAIFAVLSQLNLCDEKLIVETAGGELNVWNDDTGIIWLQGPVKKVTEGIFFTPNHLYNQ